MAVLILPFVGNRITLWVLADCVVHPHSHRVRSRSPVPRNGEDQARYEYSDLNDGAPRV
jgi:hypothetical protein